MAHKIYWKLGLLAIFLIILTVIIGAGLCNDTSSCLGVKILSAAERDRLSHYEYADLSQQLFQNGREAAIDRETATIYISQSITERTSSPDLSGSLELRAPGYKLCFAPDSAFGNLKEAVAEGHSFSLLAVNNNRTYMEYRVVFTSLPVIRMEGSVSGKDDEGRDIFSGDLCLWTPNDPDTGHYTAKSSNAQWHTRGQASSYFPKTSLKITLKTQGGDNRNLAMLGLGEDDDWILNAMYLDDTKIREKLIIDLWNDMQKHTDYQFRMSSGEYVEVITNGKYHGLFLLQRRVDMKYLELDKQTVSLFKGTHVFSTQVLKEAYDLVYSPLSSQAAYDALLPYFAFIQGTDLSNAHMIDMRNWIDLALFVEFGCLLDNYRFNNIYYILSHHPTGNRLSFVPWDTDLSLGIYFWIDNGTHYELDNHHEITAYERMEKEYLLSVYPDLHTQMANRWQVLSSSLFAEPVVCSKATTLHSQITHSGALEREQVLWGTRFDGADTIDSLLEYLKFRIQWMNQYYS